MLLYIGQLFASTVLTEVTILYPVQLYASTRSVIALGVVTALSGILSAIGSYFWGMMLDKLQKRKEFFMVLGISMIVIVILYWMKLFLAAYLSASFISSLDGTLYSLLLLERFSLEELNKQNSRLSQFSLGGNILGNMLAAFYNSVFVMLIFAILAFSLMIFFIPNYIPPVKQHNDEHLEKVNTKILLLPLLSFLLFNFAAQVFYTLFIPLNYLMNNPTYVIFISYAILYVVEEVVYIKVPNIVKDKEKSYSIIIPFLRALIMLWLGWIVMLNLKIGIAIISVFIIFGTLWTFYNISFFTLLFKVARKNKGSILGIFNLSSNLASTIGSVFAGSVANESFSLAYLSGFYSFMLSLLLILNLRLKAKNFS